MLSFFLIMVHGFMVLVLWQLLALKSSFMLVFHCVVTNQLSTCPWSPIASRNEVGIVRQQTYQLLGRPYKRQPSVLICKARRAFSKHVHAVVLVLRIIKYILLILRWLRLIYSRTEGVLTLSRFNYSLLPIKGVVLSVGRDINAFGK